MKGALKFIAVLIGLFGPPYLFWTYRIVPSFANDFQSQKLRCYEQHVDRNLNINKPELQACLRTATETAALGPR